MFPGFVRQPQLAFVLSTNGKRLDVQKTERFFGYPGGGYPVTVNGKRTQSDRYRPIGVSMGIFEYLGTYYFDTFFSSWGDFEGKRRTDKNIADTLGVFVNEKGNTRQVCEYLLTN
jgi:hypothetical protein